MKKISARNKKRSLFIHSAEKFKGLGWLSLIFIGAAFSMFFSGFLFWGEQPKRSETEYLIIPDENCDAQKQNLQLCTFRAVTLTPTPKPTSLPRPTNKPGETNDTRERPDDGSSAPTSRPEPTKRPGPPPL